MNLFPYIQKAPLDGHCICSDTGSQAVPFSFLITNYFLYDDSYLLLIPTIPNVPSSPTLKMMFCFPSVMT